MKIFAHIVNTEPCFEVSAKCINVANVEKINGHR